MFRIVFFFFLFSATSCTKNDPKPIVIDPSDNNQPTGSGNNDVLIWAEEFDYDGDPDSDKWSIETGNGEWGWGNGEIQYYKNQNINVSDGTLKIKAKRENYGGFNYTSGRMKTQGKFSFRYGKAEIRAKLPSTQGTWPAIWLLGSSHSSLGWPFCGEIDIMEQRGQPNDKSYVLGTVHWNNGSVYNPASHSIDSENIENLSNQWHIFTLVWTEDYIKIGVDNNYYYQINTNDSMPFDASFFFIVNVAIGGTLGGNVDPDFYEDTMEIDYIRVYQ